MLHSVALVIVDIVKSRTIHNRLREEVGTKADSHYTKKIYAPFRQRVDALLAAHDGRLDNDTGDQIAAFFDHTQDAILFAVGLQQAMSAEPIAVPDNCGCPHLQLHAAVGCGTMETEAYEKPGSVKVGAFNELARILGVTADGQILITPEARESAGRIPDATWQEWDVVLPKEEDRIKVLELLWDGREPQRPKDMASVSQTALALATQNKHLTEEVANLKANLTAALERVQARADTGDPQALAAIDQARSTGDLTQLDAALDAEWARREAQLKDQFRDVLELSRESAAVAFMHGDIDKAMSRTQTVLRIAPDDLDAVNLLGKIHLLHGDLPAAEQHFKRELQLAGADLSHQSRPLGRLGSIARTRGNLDEAEKLYREGLEIDRKLGRLEGQANQLNGLGAIAKIRGNLDEAEKRYRQSLEINRKLGRLEGQANQLNSLGVIARTRGDLDGSEKLLREALEINRKLGRLEGQANQLNSLGVVAQTRGNLDEAEKLYRESLEIDRKLGRLEGQAGHLGNLGLIASTRGNLDEADKLLREALELFRKLGSLQGQAMCLVNLSDVSRDRGNWDAANTSGHDGLQLARQCGHAEFEGEALESLGKTAKQRGDPAEARRLWTEGRDVFARIGMTHKVKQLQDLIDGLPAE